MRGQVKRRGQKGQEVERSQEDGNGHSGQRKMMKRSGQTCEKRTEGLKRGQNALKEVDIMV